MAELNLSDEDLTQSDIFDHFHKIAGKYDELFGMHYSRIADTVIRLLNLQPDDRLVDVGGATGGVAEIIWTRAGLKCPPLIVDPNKNLLEIAKGRGLDTLLVPADTFFSSPSACQYNKYLFCHSTHYFPDRRTTFEKAFAGIPVGSVLLIIDEDSTRLAMPLFSKALEMQNLQQKSGNLSLDLSDAGFVIEQQEGKMPFSYTKEEWYRKLRGRYRAVLEVFTDEEIEAGIAELERSTLKDTDVVQFENTYRYFLAVKEN